MENMKKIVIGILAHVDSGKTTLSEALLYRTGEIRKLGRVDHRDAFLDNNIIERERGITIFSKQALFSYKNASVTLLDTPGHIDFSGETERTLQVIDAAVLVISGTEGIQSHTLTLWRLLERNSIPTFIFVNKMDMPGADKQLIMTQLSGRLNRGCVDFTLSKEEMDDSLSVCDENLMNEYLEKEVISDDLICNAINSRNVIPCFFGSALKLTGIDQLLDGIEKYTVTSPYEEEFSARIYKISEDGSGSRLTHMKITGGKLSVRDQIKYITKSGEEVTEKVNRIRIYSGEKFRFADTAEQGDVCAVSGLSQTFAGQGLGTLTNVNTATLEPVLTYSIYPPENVDPHNLMKILHTLEDEDPTINAGYNEQVGEINISLMGEVQLEVVKRIISERFGMEVSFGEGKISYRETIASPCDGAGHYEPLRHYAEVHLHFEPLERGSGLQFDSDCSEDILSRNWQRLVITHLREKVHKGVLTGSPVTDMKITLTAGKAHLKHTEGGDFRQATYRAVRQGLRRAESVLLEPYYTFRLEVPSSNIGRAMIDIKNMGGSSDAPQIDGEFSIICGYAPVSEMRHYHVEVANYTGGKGRLFCTVSGYDKCHNSDEVISQTAYDPDSDLENTADSVFCSHGAGYTVAWNEAEEHMHVQPLSKHHEQYSYDVIQKNVGEYVQRAAEDKELMEIFERTYGKIKRREREAMHTPKEINKTKNKPVPIPKGQEYMLVDGYNIIFAWDELKKDAEKSLDLARSSLINRMCNYQGFKRCELILVFDAYKVKDQIREVEKFHNISIVYTKEAETADTYIERTAHELSKNYRVRVATSDRMEQVIIAGDGALRVSAEEFHYEVMSAEKAIKEYIDNLNK